MTAARGAAVILVTGAAGGLGRACVARLRERGSRVIAWDRALADIPCGATALSVASVDVTDQEAICAGVAQIESDCGRLDHVVHLAGIAGKGPIDAVSREEWQHVLDVNLTSAFLLAQAVHAPLARTHGSLTLTSSSNAANGGSALSGPAYAVSKAGLVNLMRYLAREWAPEGIRVNCISPGPIDTPMVSGRFDAATREGLAAAVPLGRIGEPREVAHAVDYLTSPSAAFVTGTVMNVSGGLVMD